ncbi:MAG: DsbE family thiol:disulfide interchange protein [Pseudomonadota bacterium]
MSDKDTDGQPAAAPARRGARLFLLIPPLIFAAMAAGFYLALQRETPDALPSALAGRAAPALDLPALGNHPTPDAALLAAPGVKLVNFWASWCGPCRLEHPILMQAAAAGVPVIGINYKDRPSNAQGFLRALGNPYTAIGVDENGRAGLDWGLYGVPETFAIDGDGNVLLRFAGPLTADVFSDRFQPLLNSN